MSGLTNLTQLLASMEPVLADGVFVFVTVAASDVPSGVKPVVVCQEMEGTTLILKQDEAEAAGLDYEFPCRMITLNIHSALDAVGFLAAVSTRLVKLGIGVNPVSGFYHDHLFIPHDRADDVMAEIRALSAESAEGTA